MRAVVHDRYGPPEVLRLEEVEKPVPAEDEVLVRIHATTVNRTDCHARAAKPLLWRFMIGFRRPKHRILGSEFAGVVEKIGSRVTELAVGDEVLGVRAYLSEGFGCHAEYLCARETLIALKPANARFEEAAALCDGGLAALALVRQAKLGESRNVVVYGASGSIGTASVQLAVHAGAHVTAVCSTPNVELVRSLGAHEVIDYLQEDFTTRGKTYDAVIDAVGKLSFLRCRGSLKPGGLYLPTDGLRNFALGPITKRVGSRKVVFSIARYRREDVLFLRELVATGAYRPVVDRVYALEDVIDATRYVETGQKVGNVVLTVGGTS
jgi:NADPH:quinone reductase-like Zn-dependent oxidoreductase